MSLNPTIEPGCEWTSPDNRGKCGFCGKEEGGYARKDANGTWQPACWNCVKPAQKTVQEKRKSVGTVFTEDLDTDVAIKKREREKNPGLPPSTTRPKVR